MADESRVVCDIDLDAPGIRAGTLQLPLSTDVSAWGRLLTPIVAAVGGEGPTLLVTGASHGDEYEGPLAIMRLLQGLDAAGVRGRVIALPALNHPALMASRRLSPLDGGNMNRSFPGRPDGGPTAAIAHWVYTRLLPLADAVIDIHSGGSTLRFVPSAVIHDLPNPAQMRATRELAQAFAAPFTQVLTELDSAGELDSAVEEMGLPFLSTELGGGGGVTPETVAMAYDGLRRCMRHLGMLEEPVAEAPVSRFLNVPDTGYLMALRAGLLEPVVEVGDAVEAGQLVARLYDVDEPLREPAALRAPYAGVLVCRAARGGVARGDTVAVVGDDEARS
ncbi:MAG: succinylglutamate desuccinylase/aspartoacylase family protein [Acidihalobacter sp.]